MYVVCLAIEEPYFLSGKGLYDIRQRRDDARLSVCSFLAV
jgi:hypothetical protein